MKARYIYPFLCSLPSYLHSEKPLNIIFILCDDLGYGDLGCYGQKLIKTPNIDKMAKEGIQFLHHYAGAPVSAPSRCVIQTGLHTGHSQIKGNIEVMPEGQCPMAVNTFTIAKLVKSAGYKTGLFGKWGLGAPNTDSTPNKMGYDAFYGYNCQRQAHTYYPNHLWKNDKMVFLPQNSNNIDSIYSQDLIHREAIDFIQKNSKVPFFAMLTYTIPHAELNLPHDSIYSIYEDQFEEKPYLPKIGYQETKGGYDLSMKPKASFAAMVSRLDKYVGDILSVLKKNNLDKNTIVFFSSDNGPHCEGGANPNFFNSSGPFRGIKRDIYEGGIRVPLIVWSPDNIQSGKKTNHVSAFWDLMPTLADIAHIPMPVYTDGISYFPTLKGEDCQNRHPYLYWEYNEFGKKQAIRKGDWKLIRQYNKGVLKLELYNLSKDKHEDINLIDLYPEMARELITLMDNI